MVRTWEDAQREKSESNEDDEGEEAGEYYTTTGQMFGGADIRSMFDQIEGFLRSPGEDVPEVEDRRNIGQNIRIETGGIENLSEQQLLVVQARAMINMLEVMADIWREVRPASVITVSGTNVIDNPDEPEPLVPGASAGSVQTRNLFIHSVGTNNKDIALGNDDITPDKGWVISPGQIINLPINVGSSSTIYMASEEDGQEVKVLGIR